jgi:hypothetical protein
MSAKKRHVELTNEVESSNVAAWGYDPGKPGGDHAVLAVRFKDGSVYHYDHVSQETVDRLMKAKSVGGFLHSHLYQNHKGAKQ